MGGDNARLVGHLRRLTGPAASDWHLRRAEAERPMPAQPDADRQELLAILDEELHALPDRYRAPLVACHLQGRTQDEVAREMGWSLSTLRRRLERGRRLLGARLA